MSIPRSPVPPPRFSGTAIEASSVTVVRQRVLRGFRGPAALRRKVTARRFRRERRSTSWPTRRSSSRGTSAVRTRHGAAVTLLSQRRSPQLT